MAIGWQKDQNASLELIYNVLPQNVNSMCSLSSSDSDKHPFAEDQVINKKKYFLTIFYYFLFQG